MRPILFIYLLLTGSIAVRSQSYNAALRYKQTSPSFDVAADTLMQRAMADITDTTEGGNIEALVRWKYFMGDRICNSVATGADMTAPLTEALSTYVGLGGTACASGRKTSSWQCLGPKSSNYGYVGINTDTAASWRGRVNVLWVSPADTNCILAGADAGGLWKTNDGGQHWRNITDGGAVWKNVLEYSGATARGIYIHCNKRRPYSEQG